MTVLAHLVSVVRKAATYNRHDLAPPRVILWPDGDRIWEPVIGTIGDALPELLILNDGDSERGAPATSIRYALGRWTQKEVPVIYLPGIPRSAFRGAAGFPSPARHLFALQFEGQFWAQSNGKDWTPTAFLTVPDAELMLEVGKDLATREAVSEQLDNVLRTRVEELKNRRLEAADFHRLAASDPIRSLLQWMSDPDGVKASWKPDEWKAFCALARKQFNVDPEKDGALVAGERLVEGQTQGWNDVWRRFQEAPSTYRGMRDLLSRVQPAGLFSSNSERLPQVNARLETELRLALQKLHDTPADNALPRLAELCTQHAPRSKWVWAALEESPLANAAFHLGVIADRIAKGLAGSDWDSIRESYLENGWIIDAAAWQAIDAARAAEDAAAVTTALRAVYLPWLEKTAERVQRFTQPYPYADTEQAWSLPSEPGNIIVFVDGLRFDVAKVLCLALERHFEVECEGRWAALPTVTATAKPAWMPFTERLEGARISEAFEPSSVASQKPLKATEFRSMRDDYGWRWVEPSSVGDPQQRGWTEAGAFDRYGHDDGARLAWRIEEEIESISQRVRELLKAGWAKVSIITDHGWLLMPGGLPKIDLPKHLTVSRWGRCAIPSLGAVHGFPCVRWFWGNEHDVVLAPGVAAFKAGTEYTHGGLSLQEALTPVITVRPRKESAAVVSIESIKWIGLRLHATLSGSLADVTIDLRTKAADPESSVLTTAYRSKRPDENGKVSLAVENDDTLGSAALFVVLKGKAVIAKQAVTIGGD